jgi:trans-aconitate 2-methyltransferase
VTTWDPERYARFAAERSVPFDDLLSLVRVRPGLRAIDLGSGTGELTARLAERLPGSDVLGVDSSDRMLARARALEHPGLRFERAAIESTSGRWDLVFSNAALHWVDDHAALISRLYGMLAPGGQLAAQFPAERRPASYALIREVADVEPFREALAGWTQRWPVLALERYAEALYACGACEIVAFEKVYPHVLADADALAEWQKGTALLPYLQRLPSVLHGAFEATLRERLRARWPTGPIFFPFRRTLIAGRRPD